MHLTMEESVGLSPSLPEPPIGLTAYPTIFQMLSPELMLVPCLLPSSLAALSLFCISLMGLL